MADLCRGSGGVTNTAYGTIVSFGSAALAEFFSKGGIPRGAAAIAAGVLAGTTYNLLSICSATAPDMPTLSPQDYVDALNPQSTVAFATAQAKFRQWFLAQFWCTLCHCNDGQPCAPPATTAPQPGDQNPGVPDQSATQPCWNLDLSGVMPSGTPTSAVIDITTRFVPVTSSVTVTPGGSGYPATAQLIPVGASHLTLGRLCPTVAGATVAPASQIDFYDASGTNVQHTVWINGFTSPFFSNTVTIPSTAVSWTVWLQNQNTQAIPYEMSISFFCNSTGPQNLTSSCCPPDPNVELKLEQIINLILSLPTGGGGGGGLTGYTKGTVHTGLTGSSSLTVSKLAGVQVVITAQPSTKVEAGNPPYIFDMGWLSILTGDGMIEERRLTRSQQLWLPSLMPLAVSFGYYLNPGVVATITELLPA